ncbi:MAG: TIGR02757 family protein [Bacteroidota bacterium]
MKKSELKRFLDSKVVQYNHLSFIEEDPLGIPHRFTKQQDIEIAGFFAALLAWGNRKSIINSCNKLLGMMGGSPYEFILNFDSNEQTASRNAFKNFVHRTFNEMDLWHLFNFLQHHYAAAGETTLETAFTRSMQRGDTTLENGLTGFHRYVFGYNEFAGEEKHCRKHIATPEKKSACKRLNMYLRWMVRADDQQVDFGIWKNIQSSQLICPLDVHVSRVARKLNILKRPQNDWQAALELTACLKSMDADDPVKYDYALFGLGVMEHY